MKDLIRIENKDGKAVVSSRIVAEDFEKQHKNVLRDIEEILSKMNTSQNRDLFIESEYKASNGKMNKEYLLTRDGFSLLVMGFTGVDALKWKLQYIEAFNKMEELIKNQLIIKQDSYMIADPIERAKRWIEEQEEAKQLIEQKQAVIDEQQPLVDYAISMDNATDSDKTIKQFARHTTLGPLKLFEFFREHKIFITGGLYHNQPYQVYIDRGYFKVVTKVNQKPNGDSYTYEQTYITPKGETAVFKKYPHLKRTK